MSRQGSDRIRNIRSNLNRIWEQVRAGLTVLVENYTLPVLVNERISDGRVSQRQAYCHLVVRLLFAHRVVFL